MNETKTGLTPLLCCPFCGGDAKIDDYITIYWVRCVKCEAIVFGERSKELSDGVKEADIDFDYYRNTAINAWNKRAT